jgi:Uma2 family endonuclease
MPTKQLITVDEYLRMSFDDGDHEYVDGEIEERNLGELSHAELQKLLVNLLEKAGLFAIQEVRLKVSDTRYRVPDVQAFRVRPNEEVFTQAPDMIAEVLSPEDRVSRMVRKCADYHYMGVENIYLLDPYRQSIQRFDGADFRTVQYVVACEISIPYREIFPPAE